MGQSVKRIVPDGFGGTKPVTPVMKASKPSNRTTSSVFTRSFRPRRASR
jgi:hypothetical protein